jgi:hypothetical protein
VAGVSPLPFPLYIAYTCETHSDHDHLAYCAFEKWHFRMWHHRVRRPAPSLVALLGRVCTLCAVYRGRRSWSRGRGAPGAPVCGVSHSTELCTGETVYSVCVLCHTHCTL